VTQIGEFLKQYPNNIDAQYELAQIYLSKQDKARAKAYLVAVLNLNPEHANANYQLGELVLADGDKETAKALFSRVFVNNQANEQVRAKLIELGVNPDDLLK
jgi:TolA-binding protein